MKNKIIPTIFAITTAFSLAACGEENNSVSKPNLSGNTDAVQNTSNTQNSDGIQTPGNSGNTPSNSVTGGLAGQYKVADGGKPWWCNGDMYIERRGSAFQVSLGETQRYAGFASESAVTTPTQVSQYRYDDTPEVIGTIALFRSGTSIRAEFRSFSYSENTDDDPSNDIISSAFLSKSPSLTTPTTKNQEFIIHN